MNELYTTLEATHCELEKWVDNVVSTVIKQGFSDGEHYTFNHLFSLVQSNYNLYIEINDSYEVKLKLAAKGDFEIDFLECGVQQTINRHGSASYMQAGAPHQMMDNRSSDLSRSTHNALAASVVYQLTEYIYKKYGDTLVASLASQFN